MKSIILCVLGASVANIFGCSRPSESVNNGIKPDSTETHNPVNPAEKSGTGPLNPAVVVEEMKKELGAGFIVESLPPFVISGNISQSEFDDYKTHTIRGCSAALYQDYFTKKPDYPLKVCLFKDAASYEAYCLKTVLNLHRLMVFTRMRPIA